MKFYSFDNPDIMRNPIKSAALSLLIPSIFLLAGCAKPPIAYKPRPPAIPPGISYPEFPQIQVEVNGQKISPLVPTLFFLPKEHLSLRIEASNRMSAGSQSKSRPKTESWEIRLNGRPMISNGGNIFSGTVPSDPGFYLLEIENLTKGTRGPGSEISLPVSETEKSEPSFLVIVLHPFTRMKDGFIDKFPMGSYPDPEEASEKVIPRSVRSFYLPPKGFIEVTDPSQGIQVSRHYRLKDFFHHPPRSWPQFIALSPALLLKIELLTLYLKQYSLNPEARLTVLSGFRSPAYNQSVSGASWSRHIYGDGVDIIVDQSPQDGMMDDLNRDGRLDREDVMILAKFIEEIEIKTGLSGGSGVFSRGKNGPSLHIDTRGFKARW